MRLLKPLAFSLALLGTALVNAHDDATLDKTKAPNGGQLRMAGAYHYELVVAAPGKEAAMAPVKVYVTDHAGAKIATAGATGTSTLLSGANKTTIALQPMGDNVMGGSGSYLSTPEMKVIVSITLPGKPAEQARFTPLAKDEAGKH